MRVVLIGGLTSILAALLVLGARVVTRVRHVATGAQTASADDTAPPSPALERRFSTLATHLPSIVAPPCTPEPGHACVAGRLVLGAAVRERWAHTRAESETDQDDDDDESDEENDDESKERAGDEQRDVGAVARRRRPALPPEAPFSDFFTVDARPLPRAVGGRAPSPPANPAGLAPPGGHASSGNQ